MLSQLFKFNYMLFYPFLKENLSYTPDLEKCITTAVGKLLNTPTDDKHPGMLLGMIQSGKTRAFIGIIGLCFDKGYDVCVVYTKGTKPLSSQTCKRLTNDFKFGGDEITIYDIMAMSPELSNYKLSKKLIFVVKKETNNMDKLKNLISQNQLETKKILFIDDEADFASIGFLSKKERTELATIPSKIDTIRQLCQNSSFLQVTATPYSLYLQPYGNTLEEYEPIRPKFTELVPTHSKYIGGKQYFEDSQDSNSIYSHIFVRVPPKEIEVLGKKDKRYVSGILTSPNLEVFRMAILNYIVGGTIRILQEEKDYKSSFIIHNGTTTKEHQWQKELLESLLEVFKNNTNLHSDVKKSYDCFQLSSKSDDFPLYEKVLDEVKHLISKGFINVIVVNSKQQKQIGTLLDDDGQLKLDSPLNIFIGGQILDRGLTIENLIGFFYGRKSRQQDTVVQHLRIYGARSEKDIRVTRLYTSQEIYDKLEKMHEFDTTLREAFEKGISGGDNSVVFIEKDGRGKFIPCAPNKIYTETESLKPYSRKLPVFFKTKSKTDLKPHLEQIEALIKNPLLSVESPTDPFLLDIRVAFQILAEINKTLVDYDTEIRVGDWRAFMETAIERANSSVTNVNIQDKIYCIVRRDRDISRLKADGVTFSASPDNGETDTIPAKKVAIDIPCLMLIEQKGEKNKGWSDTKFWWPVLLLPKNTKPAIFVLE